MKRTILLTRLIGVGLFIFGAGYSHATLSFSDAHNFSGSGWDGVRDYYELSGKGENGKTFEYSYEHNVNVIPPAASITSAQVILSHRGNSNNSGEVWFLEGGYKTQIGTLVNSTTGNNWVDQVFVLPAPLYSAINGGSWSLQLVLKENASGTDNLQIDQSVLSGTYVATPIPAAAWLLGSGLGMIGAVRRRMSK